MRLSELVAPYVANDQAVISAGCVALKVSNQRLSLSCPLKLLQSQAWEA